MSHDGDKFIAEEVIRHETGSTVVMNCSVYSNAKHSYLVAGQESHCQLYNVQTIIINENVETIETDKEVGKWKLSINKKNGSIININKRLKFVLRPIDSIQTDYSKDEPIQRVVRISSNGKVMATGKIFKI